VMEFANAHATSQTHQQSTLAVAALHHPALRRGQARVVIGHASHCGVAAVQGLEIGCE
jgi:hypothetical protein